MRNRLVGLVLTLLYLASLPSGTAGATGRDLPAAAIIPPGEETLIREGETVVYPSNQLYDYINGGAPQFLEYGFLEVATQELTYQSHTYIFDVYRMRDPLAAYGIFSVRRPRNAVRLGQFPYSSVAPYQCMLAHGPYYIEIAAYESSPQTAVEMDQLAQLAAAALDPSRAPTNLTQGTLFRAFPEEGRIFGSEQLAHGPAGVRAALAGSASGAFRKANEAILQGLFSPGMDEPPPRRPFWQIVAYHPQAGAEGAPRPATTLLRISSVSEPGALMQAAAKAGPAAFELIDFPEKKGWLSFNDEEGHCFALLLGEAAFFLGHSRLPREALMPWVQELFARECNR